MWTQQQPCDITCCASRLPGSRRRASGQDDCERLARRRHGQSGLSPEQPRGRQDTHTHTHTRARHGCNGPSQADRASMVAERRASAVRFWSAWQSAMHHCVVFMNSGRYVAPHRPQLIAATRWRVVLAGALPSHCRVSRGCQTWRLSLQFHRAGNHTYLSLHVRWPFVATCCCMNKVLLSGVRRAHRQFGSSRPTGDLAGDRQVHSPQSRCECVHGTCLQTVVGQGLVHSYGCRVAQFARSTISSDTGRANGKGLTRHFLEGTSWQFASDMASEGHPR